MKLSGPVSDPTVSQCTVPITGHMILSQVCTNKYSISNILSLFNLQRSFPTHALAFFDTVVCSTLTCNRTKMLFKEQNEIIRSR